MHPGMLFFTGAPESSSLDWENATLHKTFTSPFQRFAAGETEDLQDAVPIFTASSIQPAWRSLPLEQQHLTTGHSQLRHWQKDSPDVSFFLTSDVNSFPDESLQGSIGATFPDTQSAEDVLSQFYEQSYAIHEYFASSQLQASASGSFYSDTSFITESSLNSPLPKDIPNAGRLTDLKDVPSANYLQSIHPQTMTLNLIVGIISNPPPRAIKTRRGADVELVELLVGDETKSGFGLNFWLVPIQGSEGDLNGLLAGLRPQDVVLVRNVALSSFRGRVYGQSLRKGMTKCYLLFRNSREKGHAIGCYEAKDLEDAADGNIQTQKTRQVREWVLRFVGVGRVEIEGDRRAEITSEALPPDTQ